MAIATYPYGREGTDLFLKNFGPAQYYSAADYQRQRARHSGPP